MRVTRTLTHYLAKSYFANLMFLLLILLGIILS